MKLYFSAGACSLSPHIVARELGLAIDLERVDTRAKKTASGADYLTITSKGYVPALALDNGEVLTEGTAIVQYLADTKPEARLAPAAGTFERYRLQEMLGYINSEIHKTYGPLFSDKTSAEIREERIQYLKKRYALIERTLDGKQYLFGDQLSVADAYLFTVTRWATFLKIDLSDFKNLQAFQERVSKRPAVVEALAAEAPAAA
jgi:glutathione S-transferase